VSDSRFVRVIACALLAGVIVVAGSPSKVAAADGRPGAPSHLRVDDEAAPLAVTDPPKFSWYVTDARRGAVQSAYELFVADAPTRVAASSHVIWRSGLVRSAQQSYVSAPDLVLAPDRMYWWTVRTRDANGSAGPYAKPARFDTGLADGDWSASWIRRRDIPVGAVEDFTLARREVQLAPSPIVRARAYLSAAQQYQLRVNGARVAQGPSFSYPDEQYYEATDIAGSLHAGSANAIGIVAHWSGAGQGRPRSAPGLIARITVDHRDGSREVVTTDGTWRVRPGPWIQGSRRNEEGDFVEHIDARLDPAGWDRIGFDDSAWANAQVLGAHPVAPFLHLVAARTRIVEHAVRPVSLTRLRSGAYVADFGAVIAATPVVRLHAGGPGRVITVTAGYVLDGDGHVSTTKSTQDTDMHWEYVERTGGQEFRPFGYLAFRYLEVEGAGERLGKADVTASARHASMLDERAASFRTADPRIDAVWDLARHSALYASQEQFLDTPTREKGQFLADAENISSATMRAFGERALTAQALRDFARSQARYWPDGRVNAVYPNGDGARDIPDFTERYVEWVWRAYMDTGDRAQLESLYPTVVRVADYVASAIVPSSGLVTDIPGGGGDYLHGIVDWPLGMRYGYDMSTAARTTVNALAVAVFADTAAIARALRRPELEIDTQVTRAEMLKQEMRARLTRPDGLFVDGLRADGTQSAHASQHANAYALAYGIVASQHRSAVADYVVHQGTAMGPMTADVLLRALHRAARDDALVDALIDPNRPGWAQILARGATYTWESWNARDVPGDSESHGWGAAVLAVLQADILGVRVDDAGAARIEVGLPRASLTRASGVVPTQRGPVRLAWNRARGTLSIDLTIPANVSALVHVRTARATDVKEHGHRLVAGSNGLVRVRASHGVVTLELGSGHYELSVANATS
jgi:alpha-L-rhamnosidase